MKMDNKTLARLELAAEVLLALKEIVIKYNEINNKRLEGQHTVLLYAVYLNFRNGLKI